MMTKYYTLSSSSFPLGTEVFGKFFDYGIKGSLEYIILYDVSINDSKLEGRYEIAINRTNGNILSQMLGKVDGVEGVIKKFEGTTMRLVNTKYIVIGYDGLEHTNQSFLFQPLDRNITSGADWHMVH